MDTRTRSVLFSRDTASRVIVLKALTFPFLPHLAALAWGHLPFNRVYFWSVLEYHVFGRQCATL